jgi:hypothetical protein
MEFKVNSYTFLSAAITLTPKSKMQQSNLIIFPPYMFLLRCSDGRKLSHRF